MQCDTGCCKPSSGPGGRIIASRGEVVGVQRFLPRIGIDIAAVDGDSGSAVVTVGADGEYELIGVTVDSAVDTYGILGWPLGTTVAVTLADALDAMEQETVQ